VSGALGAKINLIDRLLLDANLLFALDDRGVRDAARRGRTRQSRLRAGTG
jgi:hypothetical protein